MWFGKSAILRLFVGLFIAMGLAGSAISCNTMEGAGEDIEDAGENIQDAADDARD